MSLVSCIMPTRNRREWVRKSIAYFMAQDYPDRELIIVDDGESVRDLVPESYRLFRYFKYPDVFHRTIGEKRNHACILARGEYICHWDDDDFYGPGRISEQFRFLRASGAEATGYNVLPFAWDEGRRAWLYRGAQRYGCGTSLFYRRSAWLRYGFDNVHIGEDNRFIEQLGGVASDPGGRQIVARIHRQSTVDKIATLTQARWTGQPNECWQEFDYERLAIAGYPLERNAA